MSEPFDYNDPFDAAVEDLRTALMLSSAMFISEHQAFRSLPNDQQIQALIVAMSVATAGVVRAMVAPGHDKILSREIKKFVPQAFRIAEEIRLNGEMMAANREGRH